MSALIVSSIKVEDLNGTMDKNGFGGFTAKVTVNGNFLSVDFEEEFMMSKAIKAKDSIAVRFNDSVGEELRGNETALLEAVKGWVQENLQKVHTTGLTKSGQWENI